MAKNIIHNTDSIPYFRELYQSGESHSEKIIVTDPPYNVGYKYETYKDKMSESDYIWFLSQRLKTIPRKVIIHYPEQTVNILTKASLGNCDFVIPWTYSTRVGRETRLISWWNCKPDLSKVKMPYAEATLKDKRNQHKIKDGRNLKDHWEIPYVNNMNKEKIIFGKYNCPQIPEEVMRRIILTTCKEGDLIIDPFSGTGTTSKVAKDLGFGSVAFEIGKETYQKSLERLNG